MKPYFNGTYYKHQKGEHTICLIIGQAARERFIQVITKEASVQFPFLPGNRFSEKGIRVRLFSEALTLTGTLRYHGLSPLAYDIMGPFCLFPMECRHRIISMHHRLEGSLTLNGEDIDFTGGRGYIEGDSGVSFPSSYCWIQANDFPVPCSVMAAVARIPFGGLHFKGCICAICYQGKEYRLATYLGVRVLLCTETALILKQGRFLLIIRIVPNNRKCLSAPKKGQMTRIIKETAACPAEFTFYQGNQLLFQLSTQNAGFEFEQPPF